ncbi:MAG TPA: hypothetical protein VFF69_02985, partial [Phycisphaerales bacterium]|nr:hypothetical protein [Phycisphaerales bacterium]
MKSRRNRPDVRSLRSRAGSVRGASVREAQFEQLEQRKLLFSLTITPDMDGDGDGIGQATATFGYTIPYLDSATEVQDADAEDATEDFNDEGPGPIANRTIFDDSDIRVTHGFGFSQNFRIDPPDTEEDERYIQINAVSGSFWMFEPMSVDDDSGTSQVITATTATFTISDPDGFGLLPNGFVVDLMFFDEVIASYTGTELMDQNTSGDAVQRQRGIGTFTFDTSDATREAFTGIRVRALAAEDMRLDDLSFAITPGVFADIVEERIFGAQMSFSGPVGSTVQVLDLYGRDMRLTLALGRPDGIELTLVDLDDDGVPNFNDGIGQIRLSGVDARATVTMFGGTIEFDDEQGFLFTRVDNFVGIYDDFEAAGFGYFALYDDSGQPTTYGLPTGPGSVIFGAPYVRNNANSGTYDAAGAAENGFVTDGFSRADQGVFVAGGESMGSVYIHGVMHGSSRFSGAVNELYFGYMVGTVSVEGDLGTMYVGGDAGMWVVDEDAGEIVDADAFYSTNSQLTVGRTLGELAIGGRSEMHVTVAGDLTDSVARPPRDSFRFIEREKIFQLDPDVQDPEAVIIGDILFPVEGFFDVNTGPLLDFGFGRTPIFNTSTYRNDTLLGAEFVGSISTSVQISGTLGFGDPINGEDGVDMYGFAVSGANPISIQVNSIALVGLVRVLDQNGRPVASTEFPRSVTNLETLTSQTVTFTPPHAGVFYIEVSDVGVGSVDGDNGSGWSYAITLGGLAPVTLGSYRTAGASGVGNVAGFPSVQTLSGSMGVVRVGTAFTGPDGTDQDPSEVMNRPGTDNDDGDETQMDMDQTSFSSAGSLYSLVAGSDIRSGDLFVTGDLGSMYAGMSPVVGGLAGDGLEGDVYGMIMQVGGRVGVIDIKGAIAINQDPDPDTYIFGIGIDLRTGVNGGDGSIGMFRVGSHITGGTLLLNTSPGSTVGAFLVSQDIARSGDEEGIHRGQYFSSDFILGAGSDIRFADFPQIDVASSNDHGFSLFVGQAVEFVDDGGGIVRIEVQGPVEGAFAGVVRVLPVDNGEGVVIARIDGNDGGGLDLSGGRSLRITGIGRADGENSDTPISIGRIMVTGADAASQIVIDGEVEVDVWRIESQVALDRIENTTPGGDIVAADVGGLNTLNIEDGDLGRTQMPAFGPDQIGPFLGIALGEQTAVGGALGIPAEVIVNSADLQGTFRPAGVIDGLYLDDVGSPLSPYLNGLVVRGGDVQSVTSGRGIGDVILQGGGDLLLVAADADLLAGGSALEGIFGHIYAQNIDQVDVGEGLAGGGRAPFASAGIFASDEIRRVDADALNHPGAFISGIIAAGNLTAEPGPDGLPEVGGVGTINVSEGVIDGAYIGAMNLDSFLFSYADGDGSAYLGSIGTIGGRNLVIFRSEIEADTIDHLDLDEGVFDGSTITVRNDIEDLDITRARNSTLTGGPHEFHFNTIIVGRNIGTFTGGDIRDLRIEVVGGVTGLVTADTWRRVELTVSGRVPSIAISGSMVSSTLSLGRLDLLTANAIRTSRIGVSGELGSVTALNEIVNTEFTVSGPTGEIGEITAANRVTGSIVASGPIGSVSSTAGDVIVSVTTTTNRGTVGELVAARDLILDTDISKGVGLLQAGRHLGRPEYSGMIFVQGHLAEVSAGGHIFTDVRVGGRLASATIGPVANRPDAPMGLSGSLYAAEGIGAVAITGDYGGNVVAYTGGIASLTITNGSLLPTGSVRAYDGNVESVVINGGNLYGDIYSDRDIVGVTVLASADGVFGDIGVNHSLSSGSGYDSLRGQLPPGIAPTTGTDGPVIRAGWNITSIVVSGGGMFETTIHAGRALGTVSVAGSILTDGTPGNAGVSTLAAGGSIANISVGGNMDRALVLAGVRSLGDDLAPGGFGDDADTTNSGNIGVIAVSGNMTNTTVAAGMNPGADRVYNSADDRLEIGFSSVNTIQVGGVGTGSSVFTDTLLPGATAGGKIASGGFRRPVAHDDIAAAPAGTPLPNGSAFSFSTGAGTGTITFTGPGSAFFDAANGRVILHRTNLGSGIVVRATGSGVLTGFDIVSTEGASMGLVQVQGVLAGDSDVVIDEAVTRFAFGRIAGEGTIQAGGNIETFTSGEFSGGELVAVHAGSTTVSGRFGDADE